MKTKFVNITKLSAVAILASGALLGCEKPVAPPPEPTYRVAMRQLPPKPTYHRLRWVQLPETMPYNADQLGDEVPAISPIISIDLNDSTLEEAARVLAATGRYSSYCAGAIAKQKISIKAVGTLDEIAAEIAKRAHIDTSIDHENHEVRFLAKEG